MSVTAIRKTVQQIPRTNICQRQNCRPRQKVPVYLLQNEEETKEKLAFRIVINLCL